MSAGYLRKRAPLGDLKSTTPPKTPKMAMRYPVIKVLGELEGIFNHTNWPLIHPVHITCKDENYEIDWLCSKDMPKVSNFTLPADDLAHQFLNSTKEILQPLNSLVYDRNNKVWVYMDEEAEQNLSFRDRAFPEGFIADMAITRGRVFVAKMLESCFKGEDMRVINVGGGVVNEPSVRCIQFDIEQINDQESSHPPSRTSNRSLQQPPMQEIDGENLNFMKRFVPDVIIENYIGGQIGESLVVEVKKGSIITLTDICQLKYMLLPSAIKEKYALGLLICAKEAILIKYWQERKMLIFGESRYKFRDFNLVEDLAHLMLDVRSFILDLKEKRKNVSATK